jgi:hypothetical protein
LAQTDARVFYKQSEARQLTPKYTMGNQDNAVISHRHSNPNFDANSTTSSADIDLIGQGGLGAQRAELIAKQITLGEKWAILTSLLLLGFTYGLESMLRVVYQVSTVWHVDFQLLIKNKAN